MVLDSERIKQAETKVTALEAENLDLKNQLDAEKAKVAKLETDVTTDKAEIAQLKLDMDKKQGKV